MTRTNREVYNVFFVMFPSPFRPASPSPLASPAPPTRSAHTTRASQIAARTANGEARCRVERRLHAVLVVCVLQRSVDSRRHWMATCRWRIFACCEALRGMRSRDNVARLFRIGAAPGHCGSCSVAGDSRYFVACATTLATRTTRLATLRCGTRAYTASGPHATGSDAHSQYLM